MAMIDLKAIKPHKVSRDLSTYIVYVYGQPKTGKTTLATQMGDALLLAFEKGYNALPGVYPQDITSWSDVRTVLRQLKQPEVKEMFKAVIVDTIDIAGILCEKYICNQNNVDALNGIPYGQGWTLFKREFEEVFRTIAQLGYAVFFISHDKMIEVKQPNGESYNRIVPSCSNSVNAVAANMADIYCYADKYEENGQGKVRLILRSPDNTIDTGCRFENIEPIIPMGYKHLEKALNDAIDALGASYGEDCVTEQREPMASEKPLDAYDFNQCIEEFQVMVNSLMSANTEYFAPLVSFVVEKYLGKGKKVSNAVPSQVELIALINAELKEELMPTIEEHRKAE